MSALPCSTASTSYTAPASAGASSSSASGSPAGTGASSSAAPELGVDARVQAFAHDPKGKRPWPFSGDPSVAEPAAKRFRPDS